MQTQNTNSHNSPKEFFLYLLSVITLYIFIINFISLLFDFVNHLFPAWNEHYSQANSIRGKVAAIIITFPVYLYTLMRIQRELTAFPEHRNLKIRKWLLYFTLFLSALVIMADLGTLLYYFLSGEMTTRFLLKTLIILVLVTMVFYFYLRDLHSGWSATQIKIWLGILVSLVLLGMIYSFYLIGSPLSARKVVIDRQRIQDLSSVQGELIRYWQQKKQLPNSLEQLNDPISGYKAPIDPITRQPYAYTVLSNVSFQLCANFYLPLADNTPMNSANQNWNWLHPAGYFCFQRTIDPARYAK